MRRILSALVGALLLVTIAPTVAGAAEPLVSGSIPGGPGVITAFVSRDTTAAEVVPALVLQGCEPASLATSEGGAWHVYIVGAPAFVNASFPAFGTGDPVVARCGEARPAQVKSWAYACADERAFTAHVEQVPGDRVILELGDRVLELTQRMSGSGIRYATADDAVWYLAKGDDATIEEDGVATYTDCLATPVVSEAAEALSAQAWEWLGTSQGGVVTLPNTAGDTTLTFSEDGSLGVGTDCNGYFGVYTVQGAALTLEVQGGTLMFCPDETTTETEVIQALGEVTSYTLDGDSLLLHLPGGRMTFTAAR